MLSSRAFRFMFAFSTLAAALALALGGGLARAEDPDPRFSAYLKAPETREAVANVIRNQIGDWNFGCTEIEISDDSNLSIQRPIAFAEGSDKPTDGAWVQSMIVDACGVKHLHNIESVAHDGDIETAPRLNGTTLADVELQNDAMSSVLLGAGLKAGDDCEDKFVIDTEFKAYEGDPIPNAKAGPDARAWREEWTVWACKKEIVVPVVFTPDDTGTGINVLSSDARVKD